MRRWIGAIGLLATLSGCASFHWSKDEEDQWWAEDKAKHVSLSAASSFGTTWGARALGAPSAPAAAGGFTFTISGGALKELWDATASDGSGWSWKDLTWDLIGTTAGTWVGMNVPVPAR
jgi:putative lipoprotein